MHRHGDRSPITPLKDEAYWRSQLVPESTLQKISENTQLIEADEPNTHTAGGRGPFGKLSELGLLQMVKVGNSLREQLVQVGEENNDHHDEKNSNPQQGAVIVEDSGIRLLPHLFTPLQPLHPKNVRVISTNFARTIQSVQGLLVGLFPDGIPDDHAVEIDVRHTDLLIPDPQPRRTREQVVLEEKLALRPHVLQRERDMRPLAHRATEALHDLLAADAREANFGVGSTAVMEAAEASHDSIEIEPLSWNQLAEISKCLAVRNLLPPGLTADDVEAILEHAAWKWFQTFQNPRMAHLAMGALAQRMVDCFVNGNGDGDGAAPPLTIWSAHDSTLIGLLCAFRLRRPSTWPEYASCLLLELLEDCDSREQFVRFSLNGEVLPSQIVNVADASSERSGSGGSRSSKWVELVPLRALAERIRSQEKVTAAL